MECRRLASGFSATAGPAPATLGAGILEGTTIFTSVGLLPVEQVRPGTAVLGYRAGSDELIWSKCEVNECRSGPHSMLEVSNKRFTFIIGEGAAVPVYSSTTIAKGHRYGGRDRSRRIIQAGNLNTNDNLIMAAQFLGGDSTLSPDDARLLGWIVTDGYHRWRGNHLEVVLYQSPTKACFCDVVEIAGGTPRRPHPQTGVVAIPVARERLAPLKAILLNGKADLAKTAASLSREAAEAMFEAMMLAEGSIARAGTTREHVSFAQTQGPVLDCFVLLCTLLGYRVNVSEKTSISSTGFHATKASFTAYVSRRQSLKVAAGEIRRVVVSEPLWALRTKADAVVTWNGRQACLVGLVG